MGEAASAAKQAVDADANSAAAHIALAEVYFRQGNIIDAEHEFLPFAQDNSKEVRAHFGLAQIYMASAFYFHAKIQMVIAHQLDPDDADVTHLHKRLLSF